MDSSVSLAQRMPCTTAFPKALGTGLLISTARPVSTGLRSMADISIFPIGPAHCLICTTHYTTSHAVQSIRASERI